MSGEKVQLMPFWKCYYHLIWAAKHRQPIITPQRESLIFTTIRRVANELDSQILAMNGTLDHIHIAAAIPPSRAIAQWVKHCKGTSSRLVNEQIPGDERFAWQSGYGVLTFGQKVLPFIVAYIDQQKQHHTTNQLQPYLEQIE